MPSEKDICSCGKCHRMLFAPAVNVTDWNYVFQNISTTTALKSSVRLAQLKVCVKFLSQPSPLLTLLHLLH